MFAKTILAALLLSCATLPAHADERPQSPLIESQSWAELQPDVVGAAPLLDGEGLFTLDAPFRAHDAATVPIRVTQVEGTPALRRLILVVDENPAPVVAEFTFGPAMGTIDLETRVRVDAYSNVRAIVEDENGQLYMTGRYVRASGGCSAPAAKDAVAAAAALGQMRVRWFDDEPAQSGVRREAQVMLRHPNYSGLQRDQISHLFIPAHFIDTLEVRQGDETLFRMTGGISIAEDPAFRFRYTDTGAGSLTVHATDTAGAQFDGTFMLGM